MEQSSGPEGSAGQIELLFLGSGNAFGAEGRAFSSFLVNGRYLFDCGPTLPQQLQRAGLRSESIEAVFISHFHADHFFGLPFLFLDAWRNNRERDLTVVGPPGVEQRSEDLLNLAFPGIAERMRYRRRYVEARDGAEGQVAGLPFTAVEVEHVPDMTCFAYRALAGGRSLVYSGDTTLCRGLLELVRGADIVVLECSCGHEPVHLSPGDVKQVVGAAGPGARAIVTHLDGNDHPDGFDGLLVAHDLSRFCF